MSPSDGAPPLGQRPTEPTPGRESLFDPKGEQKAERAEHSGGDGKAPDTCPDCGLPFGEHPDFHMHDGGGGSPGWAEVDLADPDLEPEMEPEPDLEQARKAGMGLEAETDLGETSMDAEDLPGQEIDQAELGGDPAES